MEIKNKKNKKTNLLNKTISGNLNKLYINISNSQNK